MCARVCVCMCAGACVCVRGRACAPRVRPPSAEPRQAAAAVARGARPPSRPPAGGEGPRRRSTSGEPGAGAWAGAPSGPGYGSPPPPRRAPAPAETPRASLGRCSPGTWPWASAGRVHSRRGRPTPRGVAARPVAVAACGRASGSDPDNRRASACPRGSPVGSGPPRPSSPSPSLGPGGVRPVTVRPTDPGRSVTGVFLERGWGVVGFLLHTPPRSSATGTPSARHGSLRGLRGVVATGPPRSRPPGVPLLGPSRTGSNARVPSPHRSVTVDT